MQILHRPELVWPRWVLDLWNSFTAKWMVELVYSVYQLPTKKSRLKKRAQALLVFVTGMSLMCVSSLNLNLTSSEVMGQKTLSFFIRTDGWFTSVSVSSYFKCFRLSQTSWKMTKNLRHCQNSSIRELNLSEQFKYCTEILLNANTDFLWNPDVRPGCVRSVERSWRLSWSYSNQSLCALAGDPGERGWPRCKVAVMTSPLLLSLCGQTDPVGSAHKEESVARLRGCQHATRNMVSKIWTWGASQLDNERARLMWDPRSFSTPFFCLWTAEEKKIMLYFLLKSDSLALAGFATWSRTANR